MGDIGLIIRDLLKEKRAGGWLSEHEVKGLLLTLGVTVPAGTFIKRGDKLQFPSGLSYPLVAKVSGPKIVSKTELNGVRLGIRNHEELEGALAGLLRIESAAGVLIEEMAEPGVEVIVGGIIDPQFGPVVMFGLGGIFTEVFRDVAFALAPVDHEGARWLSRQVRGHTVLGGYRHRQPVDADALIRIIIAVSEIIATGLVREVDLNPVALYASGATVLDAKMELCSDRKDP